MSARELLEEVANSKEQQLDWARIRLEIHREFDAATNEQDRVMLLSLHKAVMDAVERQWPLGTSELEQFRATRLSDYRLLVTKEALDGELVSPEKLLAVTTREVAAGRMAKDDELRDLALGGLKAFKPTVTQRLRSLFRKS